MHLATIYCKPNTNFNKKTDKNIITCEAQRQCRASMPTLR